MNSQYFALLQMCNKMSNIFGSMIFSRFLIKIQPKVMLYYVCFFYVFQSFLNLCFSLRWNLVIGIPDFFFLVLIESVFGYLLSTIIDLSLESFYAKVIPYDLEGSVFAVVSGTGYFAYDTVQPLFGVFINKLFLNPPVSNENIDQYFKLRIIALILSPLYFITTLILPSKK